jgi:hypothetical protein
MIDEVVYREACRDSGIRKRVFPGTLFSQSMNIKTRDRENVSAL